MKLEEQFRRAIRQKGHAYNTETAYLQKYYPLRGQRIQILAHWPESPAGRIGSQESDVGSANATDADSLFGSNGRDVARTEQLGSVSVRGVNMLC